MCGTHIENSILRLYLSRPTEWPLSEDAKTKIKEWYGIRDSLNREDYRKIFHD